jgi:fumarylacetoacetate (FAA) hydrolase family protein
VGKIACDPQCEPQAGCEVCITAIRAALLDPALAEERWATADVVASSLAGDTARPHLLAPVDLQVTKACGVTFVDSMIERVIEERCAGDATRAAQVRTQVGNALGGSTATIQPGSPEAAAAKRVLMAEGHWSQHLQVRIGPDPEVFTKAPVLSSVGLGAGICIVLLILEQRGTGAGADCHVRRPRGGSHARQ